MDPIAELVSRLNPSLSLVAWISLVVMLWRVDARVNLVVKDNTRAMRELVHFVRWSVKQQTGHEPPPFLEEPGA